MRGRAVLRPAALVAGGLGVLWLVGLVGGTTGTTGTPPGPDAGTRVAEGQVVVSRPTSVVDPVAGTLRPLPADPVAWLRDHPFVDVRTVRPFRGSGGWGSPGGSTWRGVDAVTVEYALADGVTLRPVTRLTGVPVFCGVREGDDGTGCSRVGPGMRVRATVVAVEGGDPVLVEAAWPGAASADGRIPEGLRQAYRGALVEVLRREADAAVRRAAEAATG